MDLSPADVAELHWVKSSKSDNSGPVCVEMAKTAAGVAVRDSKNPTGALLHFSPAEVEAWLEGAKAGEFDHLIA